MSAAPGELIEKSQLGRLDYIAEGGQGRVYRCPDLRLPDLDQPLAFKEFKSTNFSAAGLEAIVAVRSRLTEADRQRLDHGSTWPARLVRDAGRVVGLVMPLIPEEFVHHGVSMTGSALRKEREIQYLFLAAARCEKLGFPLVNLWQRFSLCEQLAGMLALLHANNVVYGDLNAKNALFSVGPGRREAHLMVVDCDAVRVRGTMSAVPQLNTPDWEPPGAEAQQLTQQTDVYKLGLFVLRALTPGTNASTARDPRRADRVLDEAGMRLLLASFSHTPAHRPEAAAWQVYFAGRLAAGAARADAARAPAPSASGAEPAAARPSAATGPATSTGPSAPSQGRDVGWVRAPDGGWRRG